MLLLTCPYCGVTAEESEFTNGGEAHISRAGPETSDDAFEEYLFLRKNPRGVHFERWQHSYGCGKWFHVVRCTVTLEIFGSYPAQTLVPPPEIMDRIRARRPELFAEDVQ